MSYESEASAIESRFSTQWGSTTLVEYDNVQFVPTPGTAYVKLEIHNGKAVRAGLGPAYTQRSPGIISINIFTGRDGGSREGRVLADSVAAVFRDWKSSGITCEMPTITRLGDVGDWFVYNVSTPFYRDENFS